MKIPNITLPALTLNRTLIIIGAVASVIGIIFFLWLVTGRSIRVVNDGAGRQEPLGPLTGAPCATPERRPIAVMLASDPEARPLFGIGQADIVFEMPVTPNGITRMMAVYQCQEPNEIGSIRSARGDFIPLAQGLNAILAHWGGERDTLTVLNNGIIDNIDALKYEGSVFYRKSSIPRPHNGFTTLELLRDKADDLGYPLEAGATTILHQNADPERNIAALADTVNIDWPQDMDVEFRYDRQSNTYARWRGGTPEIDAAIDQQVHASIVVVMSTTSEFLYDQYISVQTTGQGTATIYQDGRSISALWQKPSAAAPLTFTDARGNAIPLTPGSIWILVDAPLPSVY